MTGSTIVLAEPIVELRTSTRSSEEQCRVTFTMADKIGIRIELHQPRDHSILYADSISVSIPGVQEPVECFVSNSSWTSEGDLDATLSPLTSVIRRNDGRPLIRVSAAVVNLPDYRKSTGGGREFLLGDDEWAVRLVPTSERTVQFSPEAQTRDFIFSHYLELTKTAGREFSIEEAERKLVLIGEFLSFCRGLWVGLALVSGVATDGTAAMDQWGCTLVSPGQNANNWLDEHHGECIEELFPQFCARFSAEEWQETLHVGIYWRVRSNTSNVGPDGGCVLLQAALERLAWNRFVIEKKGLSEDGFNKLQAADQLRLLLSSLSIPLTIPSHLIELVKFARELNLDGPDAFVRVRNQIVHPPKVRKNKAMKPPYFEAYVLATWYFDLLILSICGYQGNYSDHSRIRRSVGSAKPVPWV